MARPLRHLSTIEQPQLRILRPQLRFRLSLLRVESIAGANRLHALVNPFGIVAAQVGVALVSFSIAPDQKREALFEKRKEYAASAVFEEQDVTPKPLAPDLRAARAIASKPT